MATTFVELSSNSKEEKIRPISKEDEEKLREHNILLHVEYLKSTIDGLEGILKFFPSYDLLKKESLVLFIETSLGKSESMKVFTEIVIRTFEERRELSDFEINFMKC